MSNELMKLAISLFSASILSIITTVFVFFAAYRLVNGPGISTDSVRLVAFVTFFVSIVTYFIQLDRCKSESLMYSTCFNRTFCISTAICSTLSICYALLYLLK